MKDAMVHWSPEACLAREFMASILASGLRTPNEAAMIAWESAERFMVHGQALGYIEVKETKE